MGLQRSFASIIGMKRSISQTTCEPILPKQLQLTHSKEVVGTVKFSMGLARLRASDDGRTWYERADRLLYSAKESGRNRAVVELNAT